MPNASVVQSQATSGTIRNHSTDGDATYAGEVRRQNKKQVRTAGDAFVKRLKARSKQEEMLREILPEHMVDDPVERRRLLRGNRRNAPWNRQKKRA